MIVIYAESTKVAEGYTHEGALINLVRAINADEVDTDNCLLEIVEEED